jgi:hypothetical protein
MQENDRVALADVDIRPMTVERGDPFADTRSSVELACVMVLHSKIDLLSDRRVSHAETTLPEPTPAKSDVL